MTELRPPIFISSVMEGYGDIRDAASDGIRQAGCEPVRAEDFSAASASPRNACLDGVRSTDALVLLLGARYGFVGPSALAVTEEEYNEGRKNHKQIFVFLQDGVSRELQQQAFADRVQHYVDGHWRKVFDDPADLRELVRGAVAAADLARVPGHRAKAETRIRSTLNRRPPEAQDIVWLQTVWTTLRDEEVVDPLDLGDGAFQRRVQRVAHESEPPLFDYEERKRVLAETSTLRVEQGDFDSWGDARDDCGAYSGLPADSIDYVFTDPPFGENIFYADLNYLVESWHRACTRSDTEAIVDRPKGKQIADYQRLMQHCFEAYRRVLKPGRWITVVFHNSRNAIWNAIQEAMFAAGFVVADVRTLDKQQGSYRQVTSTAVKQDLVISAYKPNGGLEERFRLQAGTEDGAWDFVRSHLRRLPVFVGTDGRAEVVAERQGYLLFDRLVAFHVQRGVTVPLSATEFHAGLRQRFPERDGMFFLPEQVAEYDPRRLAARELVQLQLFVRDEETAIQWLRQQLERKPQTYQEIHPQFFRELPGWLKHERMIDLSDFLAENFLRYDGSGEVPSPIHAYLSTNFKELRNLPKDDYALRVKAKDRWYVPQRSPHFIT